MKALFLVDMMIRNIQEQAASPTFNNSELFPCRMRLLKSAELIGVSFLMYSRSGCSQSSQTMFSWGYQKILRGRILQIL